jgi:hypothetical protein
MSARKPLGIRWYDHPHSGFGTGHDSSRNDRSNLCVEEVHLVTAGADFNSRHLVRIWMSRLAVAMVEVNSHPSRRM